MTTPEISLTPHQQEAVDTVVARLLAGEPLVALLGLAGTGKSTVIPFLREALQAYEIATDVGAPTHRAVMLLRQKGLSTAETVHALATTTYYTADYARAMWWLGEEVAVRLDADPPHDDVEGLPWLVYQAVKPDLAQGRNLLRQRSFKAKRLLHSLGIDGKDYLTKPGSRDQDGVLLIDEASMVGKELLAICQEAYPQVVLIGDPGQLAPVKDDMVLDQIDGVWLREIHRQAQDSPIIQLAYKAREGRHFTQSELTAWALERAGVIGVLHQMPAEALYQAPLLVWRNEVRGLCTTAIRHALGHPPAGLVVGEPLVCRSTSREDRQLGFYNNGLHTIVEVFPDHPRQITVANDTGDTETIIAHLEELDGDRPPPESIPFRFAYCFTVHTSQGGEWPLVQISLPEAWLYARTARKPAAIDERKRWSYTAITRAKDTLNFLTQHAFLTHDGRIIMPGTKKNPTPIERPPITPPSAPLLGMPPPTRTTSPTPPALTETEVRIFGPGDPPADADDDLPLVELPESLQEALQDDATDPLTSTLPVASAPLPDLPDALPARFGEHEAILQAFCQHFTKRFDEAVTASVKEMTKGVDEIYTFVHHQLQIQREKAQQAETYLDRLTTQAMQQGLQLHHDPYTVQVHTLAPQGFPVTLTLAKHDKGALVEELGALLTWLAHNDYKPV